MRFNRYTPPATRLLCMVSGAILIASAPALAADKDMLSLQRDVAGLEGQLTDMQKAADAKFAALQALVQQELDTVNKTSSSVNGLSSGVTQTMQSELRGVKDQLNSVTGLSAKVDSIAQDVSDLRNSVSSLVTTVNRIQQQISDLGNQVKLMQTPAAPPPGSDPSMPGAGASAPQPSAPTLFGNAKRDQDSNNSEQAVSEYGEFLRLYPNDPNAIRAQFNIGDIYFSQNRLDDALKALNAALEQYDKDPVTTPSAYYMKGLVLKKQKKLPEAKASFQDVIRLFPGSQEAGLAKTQLATLGPAAAKKR